MNISKMKHLLKPITRTKNLIKTASSQPGSAKATIINSGKGTIIGSTYEGFKHAARVYGFYQDIKPYLPDTYIDKYRYKPHKRLFEYALQSKGFLRQKDKSRTYSKLYKERPIYRDINRNDKRKHCPVKCCRCTANRNIQRSTARMSNKSNLAFNRRMRFSSNWRPAVNKFLLNQKSWR